MKETHFHGFLSKWGILHQEVDCLGFNQFENFIRLSLIIFFGINKSSLWIGNVSFERLCKGAGLATLSSVDKYITDFDT